MTKIFAGLGLKEIKAFIFNINVIYELLMCYYINDGKLLFTLFL
ncbi:hypothetical protein LX64_02257 [Chitinophaga skermanii]|uniref:Uncharacterized protein n=1 Tax=Chitinophaga skermanii TaxID=331697 RepID=A0A327QP35_9BACT|nr:hypothetical protein LX64_02257 [Chitinophaga skermanii]